MACICFLSGVCLPPRGRKLSEHKDFLLFIVISPASAAAQSLLARAGWLGNNYRMCEIHSLNQVGASDRVCMLVELRKDIPTCSVFLCSKLVFVFLS